jgi:hypothetical protein
VITVLPLEIHFVLLCFYSYITSSTGSFLQEVVITDVTCIYFVIMKHERDCDSYDSKAEDISVDESEGEIIDSDSFQYVGIQDLQWMEVKNSGLPHSTNNLNRARDNSG